MFIKTYGCQMNVYDSERMADVLAPFGYRETEVPEDADLVVLNTCHICLLYTSPSPRDGLLSRMPSSA